MRKKFTAPQLLENTLYPPGGGGILFVSSRARAPQPQNACERAAFNS